MKKDCENQLPFTSPQYGKIDHREWVFGCVGEYLKRHKHRRNGHIANGGRSMPGQAEFFDSGSVKGA
jgi:hypothetical protein